MERFNFIEYHHARDFSRKMNATFEFIRQNFISLAKCILVIAGPPLIVASLLIATFFGDTMNMVKASASNPGDPEVIQTYFLSVNFWLQMTMMFVLFLLSSIMSIATIYNYILVYEEKQTNKIEVSDVWNRVRKTFWMYCWTTFIFFALAICAYIVLIIPAALFATISTFFAPIAILGMLCVLVYLFISGSLTYMVRAYEKRSFFDALARSFKLVRNKWWSTFGIIFVLWFLMIIISYIFMIPWYVAIFASALHNTSTDMAEPPAMTWLSIVLFTLYYLASMILGAFPNIGIAFQYFNLVEMKEAKGLLGKIDTLGQVQPPSTADEQY